MKKLLLSLLLIFLPINAYALNTQWLNPTPQNSDLYNIIYAANKYIAVGARGAIVSSVDGYSWTKENSGTSNYINDIVWNGSQFLAVGGSLYQDEILTSPDGITWSQQSTGSSAFFNAVVWDGNQFVIVANSGRALTSSDGITWTSHITGNGFSLNDVCWNGSILVAVGTSGKVATSLDGVTWSLQTSGASNNSLNHIIWTGTQFVALGSGGIMITSPDGLTWTLRNTGTANPLNQLVWTGSLYVATSNAGTVYTSLDAITWQQQTTTDTGWTSGIVWSGTQFVAVGETGAILTSPDAINWVNQSLVTRANINAVASSGQVYVAVGDAGEVLRSTDGITWSVQTSGVTVNLLDVMWDGLKFIAVGNATIITSADGITWTAQAVPAAQALNTITWSGTKYIAAGVNSSLVESLDGLTWTAVTGVGNTYSSAWGNGLFVRVGLSGGIFTSPDGITWTGNQSPGGLTALIDIVWNGSQFVAVGASGLIISSTNGIAWTRQTSGTLVSLSSVTWDGAQFIAVGGTELLTSADGVNWASQVSGSTQSLLNVMSTGSTTIASGQLGTILQFSFLPNLQEITPVPVLANNTTPAYTFSSDEAGTISYGGACSSATTVAVAGNNTITLNALPDGVYSNCTVSVTNGIGKVSAPLTLSTFTIDTIAPNAPSLTQPLNNTVTNNNAQPLITGSSDNNVTISIMDGNTNIASVSGGATWVLNAGVGTFTEGLHVITASAVDGAGNTSLSSSPVNYTVDLTSPTITVPSNITVEATSGSGVSSTQPSIASFLSAASATDNIAVSPTISHNAPALFPLGDTSVTFTATDDALNSRFSTAIVSVVDTTPPVITLNGAADVYVEAGSSYVEAGASATDIVDGTVTVQTTGSLNTNTVGIYNLTYSASDSHANTASSVVRRVHVIDTTPPVFLNLPLADIYSSQTSMSLAIPSVSDVSPVTVSNNAPSVYPVGVTTVTWTATDSSGNSSTATQDIIVSSSGANPVSSGQDSGGSSGGGCMSGTGFPNAAILILLLLYIQRSFIPKSL